MADSSLQIVWAGRFGKHFEFFRVPGKDTSPWPVIHETAYVVSQAISSDQELY